MMPVRLAFGVVFGDILKGEYKLKRMAVRI
jgi:hypothetical protein